MVKEVSTQVSLQTEIKVIADLKESQTAMIDMGDNSQISAE